MSQLHQDNTLTLEEYTKKAIEFFVNMEESEYAALLGRIERLHTWIKGAEKLRETVGHG